MSKAIESQIFIFYLISSIFSGLFLRSISMSGTPLCLWAYHTPEKMIQNAYKLASLLNFVPKSKNDLLNYFRQAPASSLVNATQNIDLVINLINTLDRSNFNSIKLKLEDYLLTRILRSCKFSELFAISTDQRKSQDRSHQQHVPNGMPHNEV